MAALEEAKLRFAMRLQTVDSDHPLVKRIPPPRILRGRGAGTLQRARTKVQRIGRLLPGIPRPKLVPPHFTPGCRTDPTGGLDKKAASDAFKKWWAALPPSDVTIFSDGSEQHIEATRYVGYGYVIYQAGKQIAEGNGSVNSLSHVFDAEAIGAWNGLSHAIRLPPEVSQSRLWLCIDSTSVIRCIRSNASSSSQWAFLNCHEAMRTHNVGVRWAPGHTGIEGNEAADKLANLGALIPEWDDGLAAEPTVSGIHTIFRRQRSEACREWWESCSTKLSSWYRNWNLPYTVRPLPELDLPRPTLHRLLALRTAHGDFSWYHRKFAHDDAKLDCACGRAKTADHLVHCRKTKRRFRLWPQPSSQTTLPCPPSSKGDGIAYLRYLLATPKDFAEFLEVTEFYSKICTR